MPIDKQYAIEMNEGAIEDLCDADFRTRWIETLLNMVTIEMCEHWRAKITQYETELKGN